MIERRYDVVYQSKQSYYDILKEAGLSWHRTQATNPKKEKGLVLLKQEEIKKTGGSAGRNSRRSSHCLCSR
ncbi:winged helix-turn-helix domain-containing protein [Candidatus Competibacter phosphatis]|nr:winged helix-turn-helix domain-containing protein [Candidatus Competibacter phosphatis]